MQKKLILEEIKLITKKLLKPPKYQIKDNILPEDKDFVIEPATVLEINKRIKHLNPKKATRPDKIPVKIVKLAANIVHSHLTNINNDLSRNSFSNPTNVASVRPIFKKDDRTNIKNYRPVSFLNCFSKNYEKFLNEQLLHFMNHSLSDFMFAYGKGYSTNHVLIHDLLIAKLHAFG